MPSTILVRREGPGIITPNALYKVMGGMTGDYIRLVECSISDNGSVVTVGNAVSFSGNVSMVALPVEDPLVAGAVWNNAGVLTVSEGAGPE